MEHATMGQMVAPTLIIFVALGVLLAWIGGKDKMRQTIKDALAVVGIYALVVWFLKTYSDRWALALGAAWRIIICIISLCAIIMAIMRRAKRVAKEEGHIEN
jgi:hypothetical protein